MSTKPPQSSTLSPHNSDFEYDVFISYSSNDHNWVWNVLLPTLEQQKIKVCIDERDFEIGKPSLKNMEYAILNSRHTVAVLTKAYLSSQWTEFEAILASTLDPAGIQQKLLPILLEHCEIPKRISMLTYANLTKPDSRNEQLNKLISTILKTSKTGKKRTTRPSKSVSFENPFGDQGKITYPNRFFNREELLRRIFEELRKGANISLLGESQVGKSSLISMICQFGPDELNLPRENFIDFNFEWVDDENEFFEFLCDRLKIPFSRGNKLSQILLRQNKRYILCLDEIEKMTWDGFTKKLRSQLRGLSDGSDSPLTLVIASRTPLATLFPDSPLDDSPLAGICNIIDVAPFSEKKVREFILHRLKNNGIQFTGSEIEQLWRLTQGNPGKLQRQAAELYRKKLTN